MKAKVKSYKRKLNNISYDEYFDYLKSIDMPANLAAFALDINRYVLSGEDTLHDSWITAFNVSKSVDIEGYVDTKVGIDLLCAMHHKTLSLNYFGVQEVDCSLGAKYNQNRPVDLLAHEFTRSERGLFQHFIEFDAGVWIRILFSQFDYKETHEQ
ncbi:MAG: hypothetical protein LBO72_09255 [Helicobacteraceae bacterium]|jgi:hypothetical protein|nr:hypothetical protein [Helicobacteraceae bacterium]